MAAKARNIPFEWSIFEAYFELIIARLNANQHQTVIFHRKVLIYLSAHKCIEAAASIDIFSIFVPIDRYDLNCRLSEHKQSIY